MNDPIEAGRLARRKYAARVATERKAQGYVRRAYWLTPEQHKTMQAVAESLRNVDPPA